MIYTYTLRTENDLPSALWEIVGPDGKALYRFASYEIAEIVVRLLNAEHAKWTAARPKPIGYVVVTPGTKYAGWRMPLDTAREFAAAYGADGQVCALVPVDAPNAETS